MKNESRFSAVDLES